MILRNKILWLIFALLLTNMIATAKVGYEIRNRMGYGHGLLRYFPIARIKSVEQKGQTNVFIKKYRVAKIRAP